MRSLLLRCTDEEPLLAYARARMREAEEDFLYTGKAFLSLLAYVEGECLDSIQAKLLPHKLSLDGSDSLSIVDTGLRPCSTHLDMRNCRSHRESVVAQSSTSNIYDLRDRPATSHLAHHGSMLREVQGEMRDPMASSDSRAGGFLEAYEKAIPQAIDTMENRSSLLLSFQTQFGSLSPSLLSPDCHGSPVMKTKFTIPEEATVTHWVHSYAQLCNLYGENYDRLKAVMQIGDESFRKDAKEFIDPFCYRWSLENPWSRLPEENPTSKGSLTERILKSFYSAEIIEFESAIDPVKLRMARILLYHHYKQKYIGLTKDPGISSYLSQGKGIASVANDMILEEIYGCYDQNTSEEAKRKRVSRFNWHKKVGQRWSFVASHLGVGIILTCSHELATHVTSPKSLSDRDLEILVTYLFYGYPEGVRISRLVDPLIVSALKGDVLDPYSMVAITASEVNKYKQENERFHLQLQHDWQPLDIGQFVPIISL